MTTDTGAGPDTASDKLGAEAAKADAAMARLQEALRRLDDGDLHRAHRDGGWTVAQVISHMNVATLIWLGDLERLSNDPDLRFFFREEIGHDALRLPAADDRHRGCGSSLAPAGRWPPACPRVDPALPDRTVEIPDLGTMTVAEWTPIIAGHLSGARRPGVRDHDRPRVRCPRGSEVRAAVLTGIEQVRIEDRPEPDRPARLGRRPVESASLCGTDSHQYDGRIDTPFPRVPGHDFAGRVESVGDGVDEALVGRPGGGQAVAAVRRLRRVRRGQAAGLQEARS